MTTREEVVRVAQSYIDTPWQHQGRIPGRALDCVGVVIKTAHALGLSTFDNTSYNAEAQWHMLLDMFRAELEEVQQVQLGTILCLRQLRHPCHCGIVGERGGKQTLIHAHCTREKVVEELLTPFHLRAVRARFDYRGLS